MNRKFWGIWLGVSSFVLAYTWAAASNQSRNPALSHKKTIAPATYELLTFEGESGDELASKCLIPTNLQIQATQKSTDGASLAQSILPQISTALLSDLQLQPSDVTYTIHEHWTDDLYYNHDETPDRVKSVKVVFGVHEKESRNRLATIVVTVPADQKSQPNQINLRVKDVLTVSENGVVSRNSKSECPEFNYRASIPQTYSSPPTNDDSQTSAVR